ncbi:MAG TPA: hypothetical protein VGH02_11800 [Rhizomicrobium sp.]|jgi:hypothetical protein
MRRFILAAALALFTTQAFAQSVPAGWTQNKDGYVHSASGVRCPASVADYTFKSIEVPSDPGFEGVCTYVKGDGETGLVRVRYYIENVGETPLAIKNDYGLMHPDAAGTPGKIMGAFRGGPGPVVNGTQTYQFVLTTTRNGYLIDCIARHTDKAMPPNDFPFACQKLAD